MSKAFNDRINFEGFVDGSLILQLIKKVIKTKKVFVKRKSFHQGDNIYLRHLYCHLKACGDGCISLPQKSR